MNEPPLTLKVHRLRPDARVPLRAHDDDAAFDLYACEPHYASNGVYQCRTGIATELPPGWWAQILCRSSLAARGLAVLGGCIDPGYRGEWVVNLWVPPGHGLQINPGDRIAQFVLHRVPRVVLEESSDLAPSGRGVKAFGSSGK